MFTKKNLFRIIISLSLFSIALAGFYFFDYQSASINSLSSYIKENIDKLDDVSIFFNDEQLMFSHNLYIINNRIFIPVNDITNIIQSQKNHDGSINETKSVINNKQTSVRTIDNLEYISIQELEHSYSLKSEWNYESSTIKIYDKRESLKPLSTTNSKMALIRLEDISPGGFYRSSTNLKKLRIISDFLYSRGETFHIAWIPRHIDPATGYDCDPAAENSLYAAEFIYTLDYLVNRGGVIGLHGYTHQYKDSRSGEGYEFFSTQELKVPSSSKYARKRIEKAIDSADTLGIKYYFFECPHYAAAPNQLKVIEKYFQYIYQPNLDYNIRTNNHVVLKKNNVRYVPTPLGYYGKENNIVDKLNTIDDGTVASFFFHPMIEFKYINLEENGDYEYTNTSPLHNIVNTFEQKGYKFESILSLKN